MSLKSLEHLFEEYKANVGQIEKHVGKFIAISKFLNNVFDVDLIELALGAEKYLKSKVYGVRGEADLIFGRVVFEIKVNLKKEIEDAEREITKYLTALKDLRKGENFTAIATDGLEFRSYRLIGEELELVSTMNVSEGLEITIGWLDSFLFSKKGLQPTADDLRIKFGLRTPTYSRAFEVLSSLFGKVSEKADVQLKVRLWEKHLEIVYGQAPDLDEFISHTYLVTLVKIIMYLQLSGRPDWREVKGVLDGSYFSGVGIANFIEEDFYAWVLNADIKEEAIKLVKGLTKQLMVYDFSKADEDIFKEIYQEIVGPQIRHRIGEYYTPEWLAELTLREALHSLGHQRLPRILDPACGSGTFLTNAIHMFKGRLKNQDLSKALTLILDHIVGIDVNPLAIIVARANYMLSLGELRKARSISIPVYVADSIRIPDMKRMVQENVNVYSVEVEKDKYLWIPEKITENESLLTEVLNKLREYASLYDNRKLDKQLALNGFISSIKALVDPNELSVLKATSTAILRLIDEGLDTVWMFIMRNVYAPTRFHREKFNVVIGNPPWVGFRYVENKNYQEFLIEKAIQYGLISSDEIHLYNIMDTSTVFYRRCANLYLNDNGVIAFVMPRTVLTGSKQHAKFKQLKELKLLKILDMEKNREFKVEPLFRLPSCVLISIKGEETTYPVEAIAYKGKLDKKNLRLSKVKLESKEYNYAPPETREVKSPYYDLFKAGAAIYPRPLWLIDFDVDPKLGVGDSTEPRVKSSEEAIKYAKGEWREVEIKGNVESEFIFATLLSRDLIPFSYKKLRSVVLPIRSAKDHYRILDLTILRNEGDTNTANWIEKAQVEWEKHATEKDKKNFPRAVQRLDYMSLLKAQDPSKRYVVLSATSGTHTAACVVDRNTLFLVEVNNVVIRLQDFVAETMTYFYETDNEDEAYYLISFINSSYIDKAIKILQAKGKWGERHITRLMFEFPFPSFNPNDSEHVKLSELGRTCTNAIKDTKLKSRTKVKEALSEYMDEIDEIVERLMTP